MQITFEVWKSIPICPMSSLVPMTCPSNSGIGIVDLIVHKSLKVIRIMLCKSSSIQKIPTPLPVPLWIELLKYGVWDHIHPTIHWKDMNVESTVWTTIPRETSLIFCRVRMIILSRFGIIK